jgi:hypothetical protein
MANENKHKSKAWLLLLLIALVAFKKKGGNSIEVGDPTNDIEPGADYLVQIAGNAKLYNMQFVQVGVTANTQHWSGYNTNMQPTWLKVKSPLGTYFYVKAGDYKITLRK